MAAAVQVKNRAEEAHHSSSMSVTEKVRLDSLALDHKRSSNLRALPEEEVCRSVCVIQGWIDLKGKVGAEIKRGEWA